MAFQVLSRIKRLRDPPDNRKTRSASPSPRLSPTIRSLASNGKNMATSNGIPPDGDVGKEDKPVESKGITFANQNSLPKLPIPDLESTCSKYLEALTPLQSTKEHEATKVAVKEFMEVEGPGLQERLEKYATSKSSYIEQFWYDSYLNFDNPVVLNLNPFFLLADDPTPARNNQVTRAASLVVSALSFVRAVRKEELAPDTVRGKPLCMFQYSRLFGTARVPTPNGCVIGQDSASRHLVVLCRGQFYWFDVLDEDNNHLMSEKDISMNLRVIIDDAEQTPAQEAAKGAVGVLSTENRKVWSQLRDILTQDGSSNNAECLNIVDTALFVLCLDSTEPSNVAELCGNMLCGTSQIVRGVQIGTCTNRWYDKLQIIVCKNGSAGINFEHTGVDGHTVLRFASDVYTDTILRFARTINGQAPSLWASSSPPPCKRDTSNRLDDASTTPHKLEWEMGPELSTALRFAESHLADLLRQHEFEALDFAGYGKNFITSMGFSPDAFVQMAFQAAYYGLYGRIETTYEPAMTKFFLHGRTEAIRTVSAESTEFVKTFWGDNPAIEKVRALKRACEKHVDMTRACSKGLGQDRHLYALYCLWQRSLGDGAAVLIWDGESPAAADIAEEVQSKSSTPNSRSRLTPTTPALFSDPGWDRINNTILSTSNCGNPALRHFGFGPTSGDGFGIGYIIKDDTISICASSKHRQTSRFMDTLDSYLVEIRKLLRATDQSRVKAKAAVSDSTQKQAGAKSERKGRGRVIRTESLSNMDGSESGDDDGMGGYGFFDAGMLLHALKGARTGEREDSKASSPRRLVGKSLKFDEY
ncbi:carnitine O-palmitoyltransferase 2 [Nannizzia gypsea CBS 118893]|uniref:Carnitine O-palmitoyltransferase 2 n=1 Tax=Arthroderma gypseum (strain ATCC MYA-4604 / CBS 118893) TaxID=535722 RepID=E5R3I7_ARTGP|nr:carnitine O-palmitoyltransferase 2 [Nannizzia gypsea CBS 118893]EFQ98786.1 carnitine O-palmitoyltransferase 2 [Nannizzia gypsea CBS 118893]